MVANIKVKLSIPQEITDIFTQRTFYKLQLASLHKLRLEIIFYFSRFHSAVGVTSLCWLRVVTHLKPPAFLLPLVFLPLRVSVGAMVFYRSEERRVGKECSSRCL